MLFIYCKISRGGKSTSDSLLPLSVFRFHIIPFRPILKKVITDSHARHVMMPIYCAKFVDAKPQQFTALTMLAIMIFSANIKYAERIKNDLKEKNLVEIIEHL